MGNPLKYGLVEHVCGEARHHTHALNTGDSLFLMQYTLQQQIKINSVYVKQKHHEKES